MKREFDEAAANRQRSSMIRLGVRTLPIHIQVFLRRAEFSLRVVITTTVNEEEEDISCSAEAKLTTKERHKYTQSSGDGCAAAAAAVVGRSVGRTMGWEMLLSRFEKMTSLPPCSRQASNQFFSPSVASRKTISLPAAARVQ